MFNISGGLKEAGKRGLPEVEKRLGRLAAGTIFFLISRR